MAAAECKRVLITGASRGIGRASAEAFAAAGHRVAIHYQRAGDAARELAERLPGGPHPVVQADLADASAVLALEEMAADARGEGLTLSIRSGYRSYAAQKASFERALQTYDDATARRYYAEPGASEHQTGLSLDAWDGVNRGAAFTRTAEAAWLAQHAYEYGFIIRYPEGKTSITGYAYESWHLRWVGKEISDEFGPNSSLTLEEYLGLA